MLFPVSQRRHKGIAPRSVVTALDKLAAYLANHSQRLNYRHRLACGAPIGSGLIEGRASR